MVKKNKDNNKQKYIKVVNERYTISKKRGGGTIKIEVWEDSDGKMVRYSVAYINYSLYQKDNGRVFGYDNAHGYHHKHLFGKVSAIDNFISYEKLIEKFENKVKEFVK